MSDDERLTEQVKIEEIVTKCGGTIKSRHLLWTDRCLFSITDYPDEGAHFRAAQAIQLRGAFELVSQRAVPIEELMQIAADARSLAQ